ncbi:alpha/beta hydrolase [Pantanalinema sp. GBBB05]|uniref:alpha/beta hydrolase n=1 Tax=Pantanalinema sp. GBBB05 TaxID=2604139 RepID=UPI001DB97B6A|nr:alpha/beta hydrolase [Pantanalinema sp. GBBB05]
MLTRRLNKNSKKRQRFLLVVILLLIAYFSTCLWLFLRQRDLIYRPSSQLAMLPSASAFNLPYQDIWVPIARSHSRLHAWWIPAPSRQEKFALLPNEPINILTTPKTMLYLCGVGRNMGDYNYLARVSAFRQLGFSVFVFDYRGYGLSQGSFPHELQVYEDSQAAWNYLRDVRRIPAKQIVIYGESLGGAIAIDLAIKHPNAGGLIMQSSFTAMAEVIQHRKVLQLFPINLLLTEKFNSLAKIRSLHIPVLFLHGQADSVVPFAMSQQLYDAASEPKQLFLIPDADHVRIYQPGNHSYLKAIQQFVQLIY